MDTLDRLIVREFLVSFLVAFAGGGVLFLAIDFFANFSSLGLPLGRAMAFFAYKLPGELQKMVPIACLVATLLVLTHMSRQNEVLALYASGVGKYRLVSTFVAIVATVSTVAFLVFDAIVPPFHKRQELVKQGLDPGSDPMIVFSTGGFWYRSGNLIYRVGRFDPKANLMEDVALYVLGPNFDVVQRIQAKTARYQDNEWWLEGGTVISHSSINRFPVPSTFNIRKGLITEKPTDFKTLRVRDELMRLKDLRKYIARNEGSGLDTTVEKVHYHERVALVFTPLIFVLLGIPFALRPLRTYSVPKSIAFCFGVILVYLLIFRMSLSIGIGGNLPPVVAGWAPNVLMLGVAAFLFSRRA